jgi:hypothetical protein
MQKFSRLVFGLSLPLALSACGGDKVLQPDDVQDAGSDASQGPGDGDSHGDGDGDGHPSNDAGGGDGDGVATRDAGPGGGDGDIEFGTAKDADCDLNGIWIGRQVTRSEALLQGQFASTWYYLEFAQDGENVVVKKHFDCGIEVHGTVTVVISPQTRDALMVHNLQKGRKGTMSKQGSGCAFTLERFWSVRGASESKFVPTGAEAAKDIADVASDNPLPKCTSQTGCTGSEQPVPSGAEDWDHNGKLGVAWSVTGAVTGARESVQRDWTEWFSDAEHAITPAQNWTDDLVVRAKFNNEEHVLSADNGLVAQLSTADGSAKHTVTLRFLGRDTNDPRVKALVKAKDSDTCVAIQAAIPAANSL